MSRDLEPACARVVGTETRAIIRRLGLGWKVKCKTISFSCLGYGASVYAEISVDRRLTDEERRLFADMLRDIRGWPYSEGGGSAVIQLKGQAYPMGGTIHHHER